MKRTGQRQLLPALLTAAVLASGCGRDVARQAHAPTTVRAEAPGGALSVELRVDRAVLTTAELVELTLSTSAAPDLHIEAIDLAKALPEGMRIAGQDPEERRGGGASPITITRRYRIEPFLPGEFEIGAIEIVGGQALRAGNPDSARSAEPRKSEDPLVIRTDPIKITVMSVIAEGQEELAAARSIVDPPAPSRGWMIAGAVGIAALFAAALWFATRRGTKPEPQPTRVPAHELAMRRLDELLARRLVEKGYFKEFYDEASLILRRYIEDRFGLHAPERTTEEFLQECRVSMTFMDEDVRVLGRFLNQCDLVKFAAVVPSEHEARIVAATVREFIERTRAPDKLVIIEGESNAPGDEPRMHAAAGAASVSGTGGSA